jgi:hypothetical protein
MKHSIFFNGINAKYGKNKIDESVSLYIPTYNNTKKMNDEYYGYFCDVEKANIYEYDNVEYFVEIIGTKYEVRKCIEETNPIPVPKPKKSKKRFYCAIQLSLGFISLISCSYIYF